MKDNQIIICGHGSGHPSLKNLRTYSSQRYARRAPNGKHKGIVCVRRLKAMTDSGRSAFVKTYKTILGRNIYSQSLREHVFSPYHGRYYSDCSSSGMAVMNRIGYKTGGLLSTAGIYWSNLFETIPVKIKSGHIQNPEVLKVGDCILFAGNNPARPRQIGHVEYVYKIGKKAVQESLRKGSKGSAVKKLQRRLNNAGYQCGKVDGIFGSKTEAALGKFQQDHDLEVDGVYGPESRKVLKAVK